MSKLYIFGIGGTGSRVLKSLTMLLAAGVDCGVDTIVPIIIDRDKGNGDYSKTDGLIKKYIAVNKIVPKNDSKKKIKNRFFNTEIKLLGNEILLKLDDETKKFEDFIGITTQTKENKSLSQMLFSEDTLTMDTEHGFKGNPNIGSVVLNQFDDKNIFKAFASDFEDGDRIFIISSIFGGTGASGFPLLRKMLQTPNLKDASGAELPSWGLINTAPIGAISVLPYFNVDKKDNVDSDTFNDKTRAALSYYETEDGKLDTLYYIADTNRKAYKYAEGGKEQENDAHFVEIAAAMSILDFVNADKKFVNFQKDNEGKRKTIYKEFGINSDVKEISFNNLAAETQKLLVNPLSRFVLFAKYMGYTIVKKTVNSKDKFVAERVPKYDIFDNEKKYQPFAKGRFAGDFRTKIADLETVQSLFFDWLQEMEQQSRKFSPFNLTTDDAFNFVNGDISLFTKKKSIYKNWAKVDNELNRQIKETNSTLKEEGKFIELFYRTTEALINQTTQNNGDSNDKYIFRLQNEGDFGLVNTIEHWGISDMYGEKQRKAIKSSNEKSENQPTSIPSPFARIALVKTAFSEVAEYGENALASYQKIVSDSLDVAEIFFTFDKWKNEIEVIMWDKQSDLQKLSQHKILHKTLKTFLENDTETYNFDKMECIYILKHKKTSKIIGATSPCTLFFSSANKINVDIELSNGHKAFQKITPLNNRSWDFQKYLYTWLSINNETRQIKNKPVSIFNEFANYLETQKKLTDRIDEIDNNLPVNFDEYKEHRAPNIKILDKNLHYIEANTSTAGGYLSSKDLLTNKIIRLPYNIQKDSFFDGNLNESSKYSYFLPITDTFFEYFSVADLKKWIQINENGTGGSVTVQLKIPHLQQEIKKEYQDNGAILKLENGFDCLLFPNVKFALENDSFYRFGLFLPFAQKSNMEKYSVDFYLDKDRVVSEKPFYRNTDDAENPICKTWSLNQKTFDRIKISNENESGILLPILPERSKAENFTFAVDFGTTNTHIEYKTTTNNTIRPFDIQKENEQIHFLLLNPDSENSNALVADIDFIPQLIDDNKSFKFPIHTALSVAKNKENAARVYPFVQANVVIPYQKKIVPNYNRVLTQLKWDSTEDEMGYFIDSLCYILRNKVILGGGNLRETKIVWFYPLSMAGSRSNIIREKWKVAYAKYFLGHWIDDVDDLAEEGKEILNRHLIELPESIAPFLCYKDDNKYRDAINNIVSIDIGGGTTDIVFIKEGKKAEYVTSFRFAANSVFGLGEHITPIVSKYQPDIEKIIEDNDPQFKLRNILNSITGSTSGDLASFFFSLPYNEMLKNVEVNFNTMLKKDVDQKLVFVLFYSALIYHTAQIMKAKNMGLPRHIAFSGNGSRIVNIIADKKVLAELSKCIFEKVVGQKYGSSGLDIIQNTKNPKEVTCKGGIKAADKDYVQTPFKPLVLLGINETYFTNDNDTYSSVRIEESVVKTNKQVKEFINYVLDDLLQQKYTKGVMAETFVRALDLNQKTLLIAKEVCGKDDDFTTFTKNGIQRKIESISDTANTQIEETFFFYPIASLLNAISNEINKID
jgi:hypothetical protein